MAKDLEAAEPALKKARQDAPKLSSLLMAHSRISVVNQKTTEDVFCSKITDSVLAAARPAVEVKEDIDCISSSTSCATKVKNISLNCLTVPSKDHQHPNFSKIAKQSVSLTSVFSPKNLTTFHLGSGMTITSQSPNPPKIEQLGRQASMRPMPTLKKMGGKHHESHCKKVKSKKKHSHSCISSTNELEEFPNSFGDVSDSFECKKLYTKLISQRLVLERREHEAKLLLVKRELSVYDQQSLYWSLKLQMLKAGRDSQDHPLTNGDGHI